MPSIVGRYAISLTARMCPVVSFLLMTTLVGFASRTTDDVEGSGHSGYASGRMNWGLCQHSEISMGLLAKLKRRVGYCIEKAERVLGYQPAVGMAKGRAGV